MHVGVKLLRGMIPKCPHEQCKKVDDCKKFLTPELFKMMSQRIIETSIPAADRIYCPYPRCSALMSRSELRRASQMPAIKLCKKCTRPFCIECKQQKVAGGNVRFATLWYHSSRAATTFIADVGMSFATFVERHG
ncbi:OLC1v1004082C1 [Oldenlandia corymbosa var. corymbosa]|uniref:OLC1v1004082C1 n=1 Tax=Oldenlandia corymbosa var. corymbosa TaxID=529605 RepID=A0AAV1DBE8_OLDCO|nr:OLC1v1004082C1 [Oldenlandia corymbosa var. corymbosa]